MRTFNVTSAACGVVDFYPALHVGSGICVQSCCCMKGHATMRRVSKICLKNLIAPIACVTMVIDILIEGPINYFIFLVGSLIGVFGLLIGVPGYLT